MMLAESSASQPQNQSNNKYDHNPADINSSEAVTRRIIQQVINDNPNMVANRQTQQQQQHPPAAAAAMSTTSSTRSKESKSVSFSSVSAPNLFAESSPPARRIGGEDGRISPPPILSTSPTRMNPIVDAVSGAAGDPPSVLSASGESAAYSSNNNNSNILLENENQMRSLSPLSGSGHSSSFGAGEPSASGDSSLASVSASGGSQGGAGGRSSQVRFSALNPNPHLVLRSDGDENGCSSNRVSFTIDRAVSWEFDAGQPGTQGSSRGSRSGLSSPSLDPPLSPLSRSRSASQGSRDVSFNDSAIEVITEAAARLRDDADETLDVEDSSMTARSVSLQIDLTIFSNLLLQLIAVNYTCMPIFSNTLYSPQTALVLCLLLCMYSRRPHLVYREYTFQQ